MSSRVLISGASIAGPSLAYWLAQYGFATTIVERAPALRPGGYAVDFRGTATRVIERMGLLDEIRRFETRTTTITMVDADGKTIARMPDGFTSGEIEVLRGDLAQIFYDATRECTEYIFGDWIKRLDEHDAGVRVTFASGAEREFDLVIGADGLHSGVRALAFGDEANFVHNLGYSIAIFTVPDFLSLDRAGQYYAELGRRAGMFGARQAGEAKASFYFATEPGEAMPRDPVVQKAMLRDRFAGMKWHVPRMLAMMDDAPDFYFDSISQVKMERWSTGRVALLGDAAFCASPMSGMGTSMAVVGAYVLAGELKRAAGDHATAFARYEATLREFVAQAQTLAQGIDWFIPRTRLKLWMSGRIWRWMPKSTMHKLMIEQPTKIAKLVPLTDY